MKKILTTFVSSATFLSFSAATVFAAGTDVSLCPSDSGDAKFNVLCTSFAGDKVSSVLGNLITIAFIVAVIAALAFLIFGGFKWILSGGDKTKVEEARKHIVAAIIGLVIVFLSYFILNIVANLFHLGSITKFNIPALN